jgi:hypothetical protein
MPMNPTDDLTPEQKARVEEIRIALEAEMREPKAEKRRIITQVEELKEDALTALRTTIKHSQNEALKAKVSMWAVDRILEAQKVGDSDLASFLDGLPTTADR